MILGKDAGKPIILTEAQSIKLKYCDRLFSVMAVYVKCNKCGTENMAMIQTDSRAGLANVTMSGNVQVCRCGSHIVVNNATAYWKD